MARSCASTAARRSSIDSYSAAACLVRGWAGAAVSPFAFDIAIGPTSESADIGMVMWSGENGDSEGSIAPLVIHARGDAALTLTDIVPHGVSLDWTDTVLG